MIVGGPDSGIGMVAVELMMMVLHCLVAMTETIRPSRNWPTEQEKQTKQRDEESPHTVVFRCVLSLTDDKALFKSFEKLSFLLARLLRDDGRKILARALGRGEHLVARFQDVPAVKPFF